ncbi:MAG TPA: hypothetical protein VK131_12795 [Candidatus Acidoferrales bacterium]|nr:hypothetical protein [Candidatus Acidoferrales bacterium]
MPWADLGLHTLALVAYPGGLTLLAAGLLAEAGAGLVLGRGGWLPSARLLLRAATPHPLAVGAALFALLAATQIAAPFNPVPAPQRNLLVALAALAGAAWGVWVWAWERRRFDAGLLLVAQAAWLVALLAPTVEVQSLRPQALGAVFVTYLLPLKVACAVLYLLCLPALIQLLPELAPEGMYGSPGRRRGVEEAGFGALRLMLWLPYCGLFTSLFFAPPADDAAGLLRFGLLTLAAAAAAVGLTAVLLRLGPGSGRALYVRVVGPLALGVALLAVVTITLQGLT